jgi:hypothetical protein
MSEQTPHHVGDTDGIHSRATEGTCTIPPELFRMTKTITSTNLDWIVNPEDVNLDVRNWQSDPSRIIYHRGKYHMWMLDMDRAKCAEARQWSDFGFFDTPEGRDFRPAASRILYLTSEDTHHWTAHEHLPLGPEGSCWDLVLEQVNVVHHEGRFYMFTEMWTTNVETYGYRPVGIGCLVADDPAGPWTQPEGVDILLTPEHDGASWDANRVLNPRHVHLNDQWLMYYKAAKDGPTQNGLATADSLTGPYTKCDANPLMVGHGEFCWRYKHGMLMMPNHHFDDAARWVHWSEDGVHFVPICRSEGVFLFGSIYVPNDPTFGEPQCTETPTTYWGFETINPTDKRDWDVFRIEWTIG